MRYDFDKIVDRKNTNSSKWDNNLMNFGNEDVLDMWVADMDFPSPEPLVRAIKERADHGIFGYTLPPASLYDAIVDHVYKYYGWKIKKEWIVFTAGVVNGIFTAIQAIARPGDEIIVQPPVYYPFYRSVKNAGCTPVHNDLKFDGSRYLMDIQQLESLFGASSRFPAKAPRVKGLLLCSPHNPIGRVWSRDELKAMADVCVKNDCWILSDEIHCDLLIGGAKHTCTATLSPEIEQRTITFMAASKTFNVAGLSTAFAIVPNNKLRQEFGLARMGHNNGNMFGMLALEACFRYGDDYLEQLKAYLTGNVQYFATYIEKNIPELKVNEPEGTYLAWLDMRKLGMSNAELQEFMHMKARLAFDDGFAFGPGGDGFQRVNLGCPRAYVEEACRRLDAAVSEWRKAK